MKSKKFRYLDVIIDNPKSWMWQYVERLEDILEKYADDVRFFKSVDEIEHGDVMFILSCDKILKKQDLQKHKNNIVIHASDLPQGKGWSPWSWEVENGAKSLTLTLFEAELSLDSGPWYVKDTIELDGFELINDIRKLLAIKEFEMIDQYLNKYPMKPNKQVGEESFYEKRTSKNQELDIDKTIKEQFDKLRVCDNENYSAHFFIDMGGGRKQKYILKIYGEKE